MTFATLALWMASLFLIQDGASRAPRTHWRHGLVLHETPRAFEVGTRERCESVAAGLRMTPEGDEPATYVSLVLPVEGGFTEYLPSWNVELTDGATFDFFARVERSNPSEHGNEAWSPYFHLGQQGRRRPLDRIVEHGGRELKIDMLETAAPCTAVQYRLEVRGAPATVRRVGTCWSRELDEPAPVTTPESWPARLDVPFRSQRTERPEIAGRICSPTSVTMVLAHHGAEVTVSEVAASAYDSEHDIYGNWPFNTQCASSYGVDAWVERFSDWSAVARHVEAGRPLILSLAAREGELRGAPYPSTAGHLIVLTGFTEDGGVCVNDPAASTPEAGQLVYAREDLERCWMGRGGTTYVIRPRR